MLKRFTKVILAREVIAKLVDVIETGVVSASIRSRLGQREAEERYLAGESPLVLARGYGISEQRIFAIIRKDRKQSKDN